jgi:GNAT superfamily N-acetyltransferase
LSVFRDFFFFIHTFIFRLNCDFFDYHNFFDSNHDNHKNQMNHSSDKSSFMMKTEKILICRLSEIHIQEMMNIQKVCFLEEYRESVSVYDTLIKVFPDGALGAFYNNSMLAYIFFHPYKDKTVKPLDSGLALTGKENCMYLHEIAILPQYRAQGIPSLLIDEFDKVSRQYRMNSQSLVSVQDSMEFWKKKGFEFIRKINESGYVDGILMSKHFFLSVS